MKKEPGSRPHNPGPEGFVTVKGEPHEHREESFKAMKSINAIYSQ
jgi:hypothetical protein